MKIFIIMLLMLNIFQYYTVNAQTNLVPNYSFEVYDTCPNDLNHLNYAIPWHPVNSSPDYFNSCSSNVWNRTPNNLVGWQYARTGVAYAGFIMNNCGIAVDCREYIQVRLDSFLIQNHNYCVEFYVSLANFVNLATNNIGVYFSNTPPAPPPFENVYTNCTPQINSTIPITDTIGWTIISGQFTALGGEQYITIGNFYTDAQTDTARINNVAGNDASYYYIDDVSLVDCTPGLGVGSELGVMSDELGVYPNPNYGVFTVSVESFDKLGMAKIKEIKVFNVLGEEILRYAINDKSATIDVSTLPKGLYFVEVYFDTSAGSVMAKLNNQGVRRRKFVKE